MGARIRRAGDTVVLRLGTEEQLMVGILTEQLLTMLGRRAEQTGSAGAAGEAGPAQETGGAVGTLGGAGAESPAEAGPPDDFDSLLPDLEISEHTEAPDDPVLARLFPDGYREDPEAARDFRRFTEASLRDGKRAAAETVLAGLREARDGGEIRLDSEHAQCWLRSINDVRLMLGTRLEITDDEHAGPPPGLGWDDPVPALFAAYDWLTELQDGLVRALW